MQRLPKSWGVPVGGLAGMISKKERLLNDSYADITMREKEVVFRPSGLSVLTKEEFKEYEGKCLGIVDGKVKYHGTNVAKVIKALLAEKTSDKVFTSVPKSNIALVK